MDMAFTPISHTFQSLDDAKVVSTSPRLQA
jgi:hypothetical protein